ncbi:MAG: winged helix-turn-helix domain-containing protein [Raoultibacter sp.]
MSNQPVSKSNIPDIATIEDALLKVLESGRQRSFKSAENETASLLGLSTPEKRYRIEGSSTTLFSNRFTKARLALYSAELIEVPHRDKMKLTDQGKVRLQEIEKTVPAASALETEPIDTQHDAGESTQTDNVSSVLPLNEEERTANLYQVPSTFTAGEAANYEVKSPTDNIRESEAPSATPGSAFAFVPLKENYKAKKAPSSLLPLILAIVALVLCGSKVLIVPGILCGAASLALFYVIRKNNKPTKAPKTSLVLACISIIAGISIGLGGIAPTESPASPSSTTDSTASQKIAAVEEEAAELSFTVSQKEWDSDKEKVTVLITRTDSSSKEDIEYYDAKPGLTYTLKCDAGSYKFSVDVDSLSNETTIYKSEPVTYVFDGKTSHTVTVALSKDTEAMKKIKAAKEAAELKKAEAAAAEAEAAAAAAAAAPSPEPDTNNYTVYITKSGEKYHSDGCQYLSKSQIPISLSDAISRGFTPCSRCNP